MGIFHPPNMWAEYDEDQEEEPQFEEFDRVIHTTDKAILYGLKDRQFWLPKSVHNVQKAPKGDQLGELIIEAWVCITKSKAGDYTVPLESVNLTATDSELFK